MGRVVKVSKTEFIPFAKPDFGVEESQAVSRVIESGIVSSGPECKAFEEELGKQLDPNLSPIVVNSGTAAIHLGLVAAGVEPGDEVIVPTWTFTASAEAVEMCGARPVFVDVDAETLCMNMARCLEAITPRTKAVIPVHFAGLPMSYEGTDRAAMECGVTLVEDAAHAFGASREGSLIGSAKDRITAFSFYATKPITTGEGGALVVPWLQAESMVRKMRLHGISHDVSDRYVSEIPSWFYEVKGRGYKYNLSDIGAALGRVQLTRNIDMQERRENVARFYQSEFLDLPLEMLDDGGDDVEHARHLFVIKLNCDSSIDRDEFMRILARAGIGTSLHFIPLHLQPYWKNKYGLDSAAFPVANDVYERAVSIPLYSKLNDGNVERIVRTIRGIWGR